MPGPICSCKFARVVKGVDLRSTAGNCAWARTPQLACTLPGAGEPVLSEGEDKILSDKEDFQDSENLAMSDS